LESLSVGLTSVIVLGMAAQWMAWRLKIPSIILLLTSGLLAGPICEWTVGSRLVDPDRLLGDLLFPFVSICVALILFEGGLSLRWGELSRIGGPLWRLLTFGALVTWLLSALAAHYLAEMAWPMAMLFGAILTVTGPTVVQPLLRQIRPVGNAGPMAKWEGIVIDPIGAVLAVLVYDVIISIEAQPWQTALVYSAQTLALTCVVGISLGLLGAWLLVLVIRNHWVPDFLDSPVVLMVVVAAFTSANLLEHESGLIAVTVMGIILANQRSSVLFAVIEFKERLTILLVSILFILLSARLDLEQVTGLGWSAWLFVACLILIIRPLAVWVATVGSTITWQERVFLAWMAPRGIVAASVASVFAIALGDQAASLAPMMFLVILCTVTVYGLTAGPLARRLGLSMDSPQGILFAGAHTLAREMAKPLQSLGVSILLIDNNYRNVQAARLEGLPVHFASILSEQVMSTLDFWGIGRFVALTPNMEVNSLAAGYFSTIFGKAEVYQLPPPSTGKARTTPGIEHLRGRILFAPDATYETLRDRLNQGGIIKKTRITAEFTQETFLQQYGERATVLFVHRDDGQLTIVQSGAKLTLRPGCTVISLLARDMRGAGDNSTTASGNSSMPSEITP
jgi:NhaP-type Na+/H+ or K+/H+ antiporter